MAARKPPRDLIVETDDGEIYVIPADRLGEPLTGHPTGLEKVRSSLARHHGTAVGLRTAVMGHLLTNPVGANAGVTRLQRSLARRKRRDAPTGE